MIILAIDLGKFNSMCCLFDTETQEYSFWPAATTRRYMRTVLEGISKPAFAVILSEAKDLLSPISRDSSLRSE
jgi:hypothetical protein